MTLYEEMISREENQNLPESERTALQKMCERLEANERRRNFIRKQLKGDSED